MEQEKIFLTSAAIETCIPEDSTSQIQDLLQDEVSEQEDPSSKLLHIKQRNLLFFDEKVRALAVLHIPRCDEETLKSLLSRLDYKVEVWITERSLPDQSSNHAPGSAPPPVRDLASVATLSDIGDPIVLAQKENDDSDSRESLILVWEIQLDLNRPKMRIPEASVSLHSTLSLSPPRSSSKTSGGSYLMPFEPMEPNILEPMRHIRGLADNPPYLAASRVEKVLPSTPAPSKKHRVEHTSSRYKIVPAVIARMRYSKSDVPLPRTKVIASLDIEVIPFVDVQGSIERADVSMMQGRAENLMPNLIPITCASKESITFLYKLHTAPNDSGLMASATPFPSIASSSFDVLAVVLEMRFHLSEKCRPFVSMDWTTNIDLSQPLNPSFVIPNQQDRHPNQTSVLQRAGETHRGSQLYETSLVPTAASLAFVGVTVSFTALSRLAQVGKPFKWQVLVVNRSTRPARLAIIPTTRIQRNTPQTQNFARKHAPKSSTTSFRPHEGRHARAGSSNVDIAQAVIDENVMYAMQHANVVPPPTDLMSLTAELRVGPLGPGQCHESEIEFVAFEKGAMSVDAIRIVDLVREAEEGQAAAGVITDITELPDVLVVGNEGSSPEAQSKV